jgi:hypothetical protein
MLRGFDVIGLVLDKLLHVVVSSPKNFSLTPRSQSFSYFTFTCSVVLLQRAMWMFFIENELPAFLSGRISDTTRREGPFSV